VAVQPTFGVGGVLECSSALRTVAAGAASMEEVASAAVRYLRGHFVDKDTGEPALSLVRFYMTLRTDQLEPALQDFARAAGTDAPVGGEVPCLTLLATVGEEPAWNDRRVSVSHKAIPLPSTAALQRFPMVAQLIGQFGLDPRHIIAPDPALFHDLDQRPCRVFFVPEARDCPHVPAQDSFVIPYGIRSVVGFGGVLPDGALFAVVCFSKLPIPPTSVEAFAAVALGVKVAVLPHVGGAVFAGAPSPDAGAALKLMRLMSERTALSLLLDVRAAVEEDEALRLERRATDAEERAAELAAGQAALKLSEARKTAIVERALGCVIGMDSHGRITDFNRGAEATFGYDRREVIGEMLADIIIPYTMRERHRLGLARLLATGESPILDRRIEVNALRRDGREFPVELTVTRVDQTDPPLFTGFIRDITSVRQAAAELVAGRERLAHIARTLQASLLPPVLPRIEGIELGTAFRALGDGYEVGGDFYDVFELSDGHWGLGLGDVCGKGSEAAVLTALVRYTIRAAAMRNSHPAAVLEMVNEAIHRQDPEQFCTAVYVCLDPGSGTVELALGGHPHPLLLTADGEVSRVGLTGRLLGPYGTWRGSDATVHLRPGDLLLLYSDGVTEARCGKDFFGEQRLTDALSATTGLTAARAAHLIETEVLNFADQLTDDLAILALRRLGQPT